MLFMTDRKLLNPDPFPCGRLVSSRLAANAFLLYAICGDWVEHSASNPDGEFPDCEDDAESFTDRIVVLPIADRQAVN